MEVISHIFFLFWFIALKRFELEERGWSQIKEEKLHIMVKPQEKLQIVVIPQETIGNVNLDCFFFLFSPLFCISSLLVWVIRNSIKDL